ncbi:TPA: hypothetical protein ACH3X3_010270 [Trebouxia sp. C0006]
MMYLAIRAIQQLSSQLSVHKAYTNGRLGLSLLAAGGMNEQSTSTDASSAGHRSTQQQDSEGGQCSPRHEDETDCWEWVRDPSEECESNWAEPNIHPEIWGQTAAAESPERRTPQSGQASFQMPPQAPKLPSLIKRVSKLLATVDPKSAQISRTAGINGHKEGKKVMTVVDPASKLAVLLPLKGLANSSLLRKSGLSSGSSHPQRSIRRAVTIVDPHSKQPVVLPKVTCPAWQPNTATAIRPVQHGSAGPADTRRTKTVLAIIDPVTSATVQPTEVQPSSNSTNKTVGQLQAWGIGRPRKVLAIVNPTAKPGISSTEATNKQSELVAVACT